LSHAIALPTIIFDERGTGVSGDVAGKITHSPQVAARAVKHFFVYKEESKDRTNTIVKELHSADRVTEIAKMLSGDPPSTFAIENAKDLITTN